MELMSRYGPSSACSGGYASRSVSTCGNGGSHVGGRITSGGLSDDTLPWRKHVTGLPTWKGGASMIERATAQVDVPDPMKKRRDDAFQSISCTLPSPPKKQPSVRPRLAAFVVTAAVAKMVLALLV